MSNPNAFPSVCLDDLGHPASAPGMDLRDWFAATAPVTLYDAAVACGFPGLEMDRMVAADYRVTLFAVMALMRGEYADAMLAERAKGGAA